MRVTSLAGLFWLTASPAFAANTIDVGSVLVTATRVEDDKQNIPANIQVITSDEIRQINATSIPQILNQLGGLIIRGNSLGQFNIGATVDIGAYGEAATSNTLILLNGQRINPIDSSSVPWESIPLESIERIEITRGGASVQYGNRAVGGAINIITHNSTDSIHRVSVSYGSFNTRTLSALMQQSLDDTLIKLAINSEHTDGWRDNAAAKVNAANGRITRFFGENSLFVDISGSHMFSENPGGVVGLVGRGPDKPAKFNNVGSYYKGNNYGITLGGAMIAADDVQLESELTYRQNKLDYTEPYNNIENQYDKHNLIFSPRFKIDLHDWGHWVAGYEFSHAKGEDNQSNSARLIDHAFYTFYRMPLSAELDFNLGYRRQHESAKAQENYYGLSSSDSNKTSANAWDIGLNYKFASNDKVYVKYNQSFRFPNIDEFWGFDANFNRIFNGATLEPQIDRTMQAGGDFHLGSTKITASVFHTGTSDQIRYNSYTDANINDPYDIKRKGMYLSTVSTLNSRLILFTNLNLQKVSYDAGPNKGRDLALAPRLSINARLNWQVNDQWTLGTVINHVGQQYYAGAHDLYNNRNEAYGPSSINDFYRTIPSYTVADVYATYKHKRWDARLTIKNVTNKDYATYGGMGFVTLPPNPGWNGDWSYYYYPSDPRSLLVSLSYSY